VDAHDFPPRLLSALVRCLDRTSSFHTQHADRFTVADVGYQHASLSELEPWRAQVAIGAIVDYYWDALHTW
jgi:hypothetical protein